MYIRRNGEYIEASYITGPTHNTLWLQLAAETIKDVPQIEYQPPREPLCTERIDKQAATEAVVFGVDHVNKHIHARYSIQSVKYNVDDSPKYIIYSLLAHHITLFYHAEQLQQNKNIRRKCFFVENIEQLQPGKWRAQGRSLVDIQSEDILFLEQPNGQYISYEIGVPATAYHDVGKLPMNNSGVVVLQGGSEQLVNTQIYLYR